MFTAQKDILYEFSVLLKAFFWVNEVVHIVKKEYEIFFCWSYHVQYNPKRLCLLII
jgi:hypothetical protein